MNEWFLAKPLESHATFPKMTISDRWLVRLAMTTVALLFLVVLAGSVVRATGSGMGCPDWPKCFGHYIPPTDISELPADYKTKFQVAGQEIATFSAFKTWTEYTNRLLGALSGFALLATTIVSFFRFRKDRLVPMILLGSMILSSIVIWLGKVVVDKNLHPRNVTIHMLGGLLLVCGAVLAASRIRQRVFNESSFILPPKLKALLWATFGLAVVQLLIGTQMRERVDGIMEAGECCQGRLEEFLGGVYLLHRLVAALVVFASVASFFWLRTIDAPRVIKRLNLALGALVGLSYLAGLLLIRMELPRYLQPTHLVLAALLLGVCISLLSRTRGMRFASDNTQ